MSRVLEFLLLVVSGLAVGFIVSALFALVGYEEQYAVRGTNPGAFFVGTPILGAFAGRRVPLTFYNVVFLVAALLAGSWGLSVMESVCDLSVDGRCDTMFSFYTSAVIVYGSFVTGMALSWAFKPRFQQVQG